jgi:hypothetical protein
MTCATLLLQIYFANTHKTPYSSLHPNVTFENTLFHTSPTAVKY